MEAARQHIEDLRHREEKYRGPWGLDMGVGGGTGSRYPVLPGVLALPLGDTACRGSFCLASPHAESGAAAENLPGLLSWQEACLL